MIAARDSVRAQSGCGRWEVCGREVIAGICAIVAGGGFRRRPSPFAFLLFFF